MENISHPDNPEIQQPEWLWLLRETIIPDCSTASSRIAIDPHIVEVAMKTLNLVPSKPNIKRMSTGLGSE